MDENELDGDGYPTDATLERVAAWPLSSRADAMDLLNFVQSLWYHPDYFVLDASDTFQVSTGGWSGNEDLIEALNRNFMFWTMCWLSSKRGGHFQFSVERLPLKKAALDG